MRKFLPTPLQKLLKQGLNGIDFKPQCPAPNGSQTLFLSLTVPRISSRKFWGPLPLKLQTIQSLYAPYFGKMRRRRNSCNRKVAIHRNRKVAIHRDRRSLPPPRVILSGVRPRFRSMLRIFALLGQAPKVRQAQNDTGGRSRNPRRKPQGDRRSDLRGAPCTLKPVGATFGRPPLKVYVD